MTGSGDISLDAPRCTQAPTGLAAEAAANHRVSVPVIETPRLRMRAPTIIDLPVWTAIYTGPEAESFGGPFSAAEAWEEFACYTAGWMLYGHGLFAVIHKDEGVTVGFVHLGLEWDDAEPELGWMFAAQARGLGYAEEAAAAVRDWGRTMLPAFVSYIDPANDASNRLAERLGAARDTAAEARTPGIHVWRHAPAGGSDANGGTQA